MPKNDKAQEATNPRYFELLTEEEKVEYSKLREQLSSPNYKNRRNKSNEVFKDMIESIKKFSIRNDENDWKRSLVCGIIWLHHSIAINTHQLRLLITKCKSSINGSFQALGYGTIPTVADSASELITKFPFLRHNFSELRQWTVRQKLENKMNKSVEIRPVILNENSISSFIDMKDEITPPPDVLDITSEKYNDAFSLSLPLDIISENSFAASSNSSIISDYLSMAEKDNMTKSTSIEDYEFVLPKPSHDFENDPLVFFPNMGLL